MDMSTPIVILTGAGLSAESGLGTFRDKGGLWAQFDPYKVATPEAFAEDPLRVHDFYNMRRKNLRGAKPNAAHFALAELDIHYPGPLLVVTQNIDDLHEQAGSVRLLHMHGELLQSLCAHCEARAPSPDELSTDMVCGACGKAGGMRPDVVWFGEMPYHMGVIDKMLTLCELFVAIGTSGTVYPAAGFVAEARAAGAYCVEINLEPSDVAGAFHAVRLGPATETVPAFVADVLAGRLTLAD